MTEEPQDKKVSEAGFFCPAYVGLRCVLLLMVLEGHYWFEATSNSQLHPLTFAVPCFFVLSGFLISHTLFSYENYPKKQALKVFYARRALRILPPFYLVLLVAHFAGGVPYLGWHLSYLANIKIWLLSAFEHQRFLGFLANRDFNAMHYWSVNVEEQFYILYPIFIAWTAKRRRWPFYLLGIGVCILVRAYLYENMRHSFYGGLPLVTGEYIIWGCLFAWLDREGKATWLSSKWAMYGSVIGFIVANYYDRTYGPWAQWKPPHHQTLYCFLIATFVLSLRHNNDSMLGKLLSLKPLAVIGHMSYGAYLVHIFLNPVVDKVIEKWPLLAPFEQCPRAVAGPLLTLIVAAIMWYGIEQPINRFRHHFRLTTESEADK